MCLLYKKEQGAGKRAALGEWWKRLSLCMVASFWGHSYTGTHPRRKKVTPKAVTLWLVQHRDRIWTNWRICLWGGLFLLQCLAYTSFLKSNTLTYLCSLFFKFMDSWISTGFLFPKLPMLLFCDSYVLQVRSLQMAWWHGGDKGQNTGQEERSVRWDTDYNLEHRM